ncbi:MAG: hypothetical protein KF718_24570 [Polyangiaceae bacterium]|nr:hypothetical protein [Polyangiaceae bacterium]
MKTQALIMTVVLAAVGCGEGDDANTPGGAGGASGGSGGSGASATGGAGGGATGGTGGGGTGGTGGACVDACPTSSAGVTWGCKKRFMVGTNWAWRDWGADFGGIAAWNKSGVAADSAAIASDMATLQSDGVNVIRWWMFPRFLSDGIEWGQDGAPSGIGGSMIADIHKALELAEQHDVFIMLTPFSFDNFHPTATESGVYSRSIRPLLQSAAARKKLLDNLVVPVAQAVESSPYKQRMLAWDLVNEPEWAVNGANKYGGAAFDADADLEQVSHAEMETFLQEMAAALRANSGALLSVGGAAIKWHDAWLEVDQDFYSFHYYDWVYQYYPYTSVTPQSLGLTKPVVIGEFPNSGLSAVGSAGQVLQGLWDHGFAGGLTWAFNDAAFPWTGDEVASFSQAHACETKY